MELEIVFTVCILAFAGLVFFCVYFKETITRAINRTSRVDRSGVTLETLPEILDSEQILSIQASGFSKVILDDTISKIRTSLSEEGLQISNSPAVSRLLDLLAEKTLQHRFEVSAK